MKKENILNYLKEEELLIDGLYVSILEMVIKDSSGNVVKEKILRENKYNYLFRGNEIKKLYILGEDRMLSDKKFRRLSLERDLNLRRFKDLGMELVSIDEKTYGIEYILEWDFITRVIIDNKKEVNNKKYKVHLRNNIVKVEKGNVIFVNNLKNNYIDN